MTMISCSLNKRQTYRRSDIHMEYIASGVLALLLGMKFTDFKMKKHQKEYEALVARVEEVDKRIAATEGETFKKVIKTIQPVAVAVKRLNEEVGIR